MPSFAHFLTVNTIMLCIGLCSNYIYINAPSAMLFFFLSQDALMPLALLLFRQQAHTPPLLFQERLTIAGMNTVSLYASSYVSSKSSTLPYELALFIPYSFLFEVVFDFFHYSIHRLFHTIPFLYKYIHSVHHTADKSLSVYTTFHHHALDVVFSNAVPVFLTSFLLNPSVLFLCIWFNYKILQEMYGHMGIPSRTSCFPQCIWLPQALGIELYNSDHTKHHTHPKYNFSKRFTLWDKVFGTYKGGLRPPL